MESKFRRPRLTVGLPVYNGEPIVAEAIESVLNQTYTDWELIICDNASTDGTGEICRRFALNDSRVRYVRNETNIGLAPNHNKVFRLSDSEFYKWLAHDDVCLPTFFQRCIEALDENPHAVVAYPLAAAIDGEGKPVESFSWTSPLKYDQATPEERFRLLTSTFDRYTRAGNQHPGVYFFGIMRSSLLSKTRLEMSHMWADVSMLAELTLEGQFVEVPEVLSLLRVGIPNASYHMIQGDLQGWQQVLDPRHASKAGTMISRYRRYWEYFVSVWRSDLPTVSKAKLISFCATLVARRAYDLASRSSR